MSAISAFRLPMSLPHSSSCGTKKTPRMFLRLHFATYSEIEPPRDSSSNSFFAPQMKLRLNDRARFATAPQMDEKNSPTSMSAMSVETYEHLADSAAGLTNAPEPLRRTMSPSASSIARTFVAVARDTEYCRMSARSDGILPSAYAPEAMFSRIFSAMERYVGLFIG